MKFLLIISVILLPFCVVSQSTSRFKTVGSAIPVSDSCFRLTPALSGQSGSVWYDTRIDLRRDFTLECEINLGGLDANGADGLAFVMQPLSTDLGSQGQGLGYGGIDPSIAIEFDTWQNSSDPPYDHLALVKNGNAIHDGINTLVGPMELLPGAANAEDRQNRPARFVWDAANKRLKCFYNGELKFDIAIDLINEIFKGNPYVFWGFTAATGALFNDQRVCFSNYTFVEECPTAWISSRGQVCIGDTLTMIAKGGKSFKWTGPNGFSSTDSVIHFRNASSSIAGAYTLVAKDSVCIDTAYTTVTVKARVMAGINTNAPVCAGDTLRISATGGTAYTWAGPNGFNANSPIITFGKSTTANSGNYKAIVSNGACADTAFTNVIVKPSPTVASKDTLVDPRSTIVLQLPYSPDASQWIWEPADQLSCTTCSTPTANLLREQSYTLTVSNDSGCTATGAYNIFFKCDVKNIFIPNAFTPNGDGLNDNFYPMGSGIRRVISMRIFDRWGHKVFDRKNFQANNSSLGWNGRNATGEPGTSLYSYIITVECSEGQIVDFKGTLSLVR